MTSFLCVSISFLFFFLLETHEAALSDKKETHGILSKIKEVLSKEQVPMFHIKITGKIQLHYYKIINSDGDDTPAIMNAGIRTKVTLYKDGNEVAKTRVKLFTAGEYKLVADIPENEKNGSYKIVAHFSPFPDQQLTFKVSSDDASPFIHTWNTILYEDRLED